MTETAKKKNGKKIVAAAVVLVAVAVILGVVYVNFAPKPAAGDKHITIEVVVDRGASVSYRVASGAEYLRQALAGREGLSGEGGGRGRREGGGRSGGGGWCCGFWGLRQVGGQKRNGNRIKARGFIFRPGVL